MPFEKPAPGWPGSPARWTSSAKSSVGTALQPQSRVWFTLSHGILNEIYCPRVDQACTRDLGLIITDKYSFFSEEKRDANSTIRTIAEGVPAFITSVCNQKRYQIEKLVFADPRRDVVLQRVTFEALAGAAADYRLHALLAPHLVNKGAGNTAWINDYKGVSMLFAEGDGTTLALGCSIPFAASSAGFVGASDGWQDLRQHFELRWRHAVARNGNGYGEHEDGQPFDGTSVGRAWPLLTGERAHYELSAGNRARAEALLAALESFGSDGRLIPEQVWDATDIPERELFRGRPSGSAMPLAWAHAEHVKLLRSLADGRVFDMPPQPKERYQVQHVRPLCAI